jgi:hypothetical protein
MADALFYTPAKIKQDTILSKNIDDKYLTEVILLCQDIYIQKKLGSTFYNELKDDVIASTLTGVNKTLVDDYVRPALKWWVVSETIYTTSYPVTNKGMVRRDGEASSPADKRDVDQQSSKYQDWAEFYTQRLIDYLCENESDYPNYQNAGSGSDVIQPDKDNYATSLYLGGSRKTYTSLKDKYGDT